MSTDVSKARAEASDVVRLRPAVAADAERVAALTVELGYPVAREQTRERLQSLRSGDEVVVAEVGGEVVGWIHLGEYRTLELDPHVEVLGLVIAAPFRGRGIGRRLMEHAAGWGRARGMSGVYVRSGLRPEREAAHAFYRSLGYQERKRSLVFVKPIE